MKEVGLVMLGVVGGIAIYAALRPVESSCCKRVKYGARDTIAGYAGPLSGVVSGVLDLTGLTDILPGLLDKLGVPAE